MAGAGKAVVNALVAFITRVVQGFGFNPRLGAQGCLEV